MKKQEESEPQRRERQYRNYAIKGIISLTVLLFIFLLTLLLFPKLFLNGYVQKQIVKAFGETHPDYSLKLTGTYVNLWKSSIGCDSVEIYTSDSLLVLNAKHMSIAGIKWTKLIGNKKSGEKALIRSIADAESIDVTFRETMYKLSAKHLHLSIPDSIASFDSFAFHPTLSNEPFFARSTYRKTIYDIHVPRIQIHFSAQPDQWKKNIYRIHYIHFQKPFFDFLVNRDKPGPPQTKTKLMPNQMLNSIKGILRIDSLSMEDGKLTYKERYAIRAKPSIVSFMNLNLEAKQIMNHCSPEDTTYFYVNGNFMEKGKVKIKMLFMPGSPQFSLIYGGSLGPMELSQLNSYLIIGQRKKIKSGTLQEAAFKIHLTDAKSSGTVRAFYKDLKIAAVDTAGNEGGIIKKAGSLLSNVKIRNNNTLQSEKKGVVNYTRKPENTFIQFIWFSLRDGAKDVIGI